MVTYRRSSKIFKKIKTNIKIKEIIDPYDFNEVDVNYLNIYNVNNVSIEKFKNLLNQIKIANIISNKTGLDLITMPIDKSLFKKKIKFIGMTEYLAEINKQKQLCFYMEIIFQLYHLRLILISKMFIFILELKIEIYS